ncbi:hypothetical protein [Compostimonas suwonensis]|nr:hypothetical protein [Compostimonas suwonensis]
MANGLWWLPSLVVFGVTAAIVAVIVLAVRARRRRGIGSGAREPDRLDRQANLMLVRADDAVTAGEEELGFALAQFGEQTTADFTVKLREARSELTEAFRLKQSLEDAVPDSDRERRERTKRIIALSESASARLDEQQRRFDGMRTRERHAPEALARLRAAISGVRSRLPDASAAVEALRRRYAAGALNSIDQNIDRATRFVQDAASNADAAAGRATATAPPSAGDLVGVGEERLRSAVSLLDAIVRLEESLAATARTLDELVAETRRELAEARALRDRHEVPEAGTELNAAIAHAETTLAAVTASTRMPDPVADVERLREANAALDTAFAEARSGQQRIENARAALDGAMRIARSQIQVARDVIGGNRGRVGADARTRLAEAERQLMLAEATADPVEALDTARRATRHANDAEALAHYDAGARF